MEGNAWWPSLQSPSSQPLSQKGSGPPYMVITLVPSSWLHTSHLRRRQSRREGGREQKTPRKPVTLGHWNCEDLSRRFQVASLSAAKPISVACKPLLVWALVNKRFARFYAYKALDCPVKKVRWLKNRVTGFVRFQSFNCFFCHGLFTVRLCLPRQLWCVSHRLCGLPQGVKCRG